MSDNEKYLKFIGRQIKVYRTIKGLNQTELSEKTNITMSSICEMEKGKRTTTLKSLIKICDSLDVSLSDFFSDIERNFLND